MIYEISFPKGTEKDRWSVTYQKEVIFSIYGGDKVTYDSTDRAPKHLDKIVKAATEAPNIKVIKKQKGG